MRPVVSLLGWLPPALALAGAAFAAEPAPAGCVQASAIYADRDGVALLEFLPGEGKAVAVSNTFRMRLGASLDLDGFVTWSAGIERPNASLTFKCPEGDVTGEELRRCTLWQGVIYSIDPSGTVGLLPAEGAPAAASLLLPDLGWALAQSSGYGPGGFEKVPWDVFALQGCRK